MTVPPPTDEPATSTSICEVTLMKNCVALCFLLFFLTACGGGTTATPTPPPVASTPFQGSWEFEAVSTVAPPPASSVRLFEASLVQSGTQVDSAQVVELYYNAAWETEPVEPCGGDGCPVGSTSLTGTATGASLSFSVTLNECGTIPTCSLQGQGTLANGTISGTFTITGSELDAGTFTAIPTSTLSGVYTGTLTTCIAPKASGCTSFGSDKASVTFSQSSTTITATMSGTDNGTFTSTPVENPFIGNAFFFATPIPSGASWYGYYDQTGKYTGVKNSVEVFAGNAGPSSGMFMGLLHDN